eukprot:jgi/Botrbrau1/1577/Bobra.0185s0001.1
MFRITTCAVVSALLLWATPSIGELVANGTCSQNVPTLTSKGYGIVTALSDTATVEVRVEAREKTAAGARNTASRSIQNITNSMVKDTGNDNIALTTTYVSVDPEFIYDTNTSQRIGISGYTFSNTLLIGIRNVTADVLAQVIDDVLSNIENGQVSVNQISFGLSPATKARLWSEARNAAVQDAYYSAKLYADALGESLGGVASFQEQSANSGPSYSDNLFDSKGGSSVSSYTGAPVSIGSQTISIEVETVYNLRPKAAAASTAAPILGG